MPKFTKYRVNLKDPKSEQRRYYTVNTESRDAAVELVEKLEQEYVDFRLDEQETINRYPTITEATLEEVMYYTEVARKDKDLPDGRFVRKGKVLLTAQGATKYHKGWRAIHEQEQPYEIISVGPLSEMMVVTGGMFGLPIRNQYEGTNAIDWNATPSGTAGLKTILVTSTFTPDIDTHDFYNDVTNELTTGNGYTSGGFAHTAGTSSYDTASDQVRLDLNDASWASSTLTARRSVTYYTTGTSTTSALVSFLDFGADVSTTNGTFQITWDATGVVVFDVT